jgi:O-antigen ligase
MALAAAVVAYGFLAGRKTRLFLGAGAALCLIVAGLLPVQLSERFATIPDELQYGTLSDRRELWDRGTAVAKDHLLEGIGAGATTGMFNIAAHNTPLELTMEGGAVSLAFFYGTFLLGIGRTWRSDRREAYAMIAVCTAWLVGTLSLSWEVDTVTWFILAILFSAVRRDQLIRQPCLHGRRSNVRHKTSTRCSGERTDACAYPS